jgi:hypothetical protein
VGAKARLTILLSLPLLILASLSPGKVFARDVRYVAISVENSHHVWDHQQGTTQADILFEFVVEGHITRMIALFDKVTTQTTQIGPVRSMRNYFLPFLKNMGTFLLFCGASPSGYGRLEREPSIIGLDEIKHRDPFLRSKKYQRPHNLFTNGNKILTAISSRGLSYVRPDKQEEANFSGLISGPIRKLSMRYTRRYAVSYEYSATTGTYARFINGKAHKDHAIDQQLAPTTVVFIRGEAKILDDAGRLQFKLGEELPAEVHMGGTVKYGTWSAPTLSCPLMLSDSEDLPVIRPPGQTIVHLLSQRVQVNTEVAPTMVCTVKPPTIKRMPLAGLLPTLPPIVTNNNLAPTTVVCELVAADETTPLPIEYLWQRLMEDECDRDETLDELVRLTSAVRGLEQKSTEEFLLQYFKEGNSLATALLGMMGSQRAREELLTRVRHSPNATERVDAVLALGIYALCENTQKALIERLQDDSALVRDHAASALIEGAHFQGDEATIENLKKWLTSSEVEDRKRGLAALQGKSSMQLASDQGGAVE